MVGEKGGKLAGLMCCQNSQSGCTHHPFQWESSTIWTPAFIVNKDQSTDPTEQAGTNPSESDIEPMPNEPCPSIPDSSVANDPLTNISQEPLLYSYISINAHA
jgi:hypothetical protein